MQPQKSEQEEKIQKVEEGQADAPKESPEGKRDGKRSAEGRGPRRNNRNRAPRKNDDNEYREKKEGEAEGQADGDAKDGAQSPEGKKGRGQRTQRPKPDDSWKDEIIKTMTTQTKIPDYPTKEALLKRPVREDLNRALDKIDDEIADMWEQVNQYKDERKIIKGRIRNQNKVEYDALNKLLTELKEIKAKLDKTQAGKDLLAKEKEALEDKLSKLEKRAYNGKIVPEAALKEMIAQLEADYRNSRHTATEEKKHIEKISQLKAAMPLASEASAIKGQLRANREATDKIFEANRPLVAQRKDLIPKIQAIRERLNIQKEAENKKTPEERAAEKEKHKKEYVESPEEVALRAKEAALVEKVKEARKRKDEARAAHDKAYEAYFAQKHEMDKIEFMWDHMDKLKEEETKAKRAEEAKKRRDDELKLLKAELLTKYAYELELLEYLGGYLKQSKLEQERRDQPLELGTPTGHKVNEEALKKEKLALMKSKKSTSETEGAVQPGQKKALKKPKSGKPAEEPKEEKEGWSLDLRTMENFQKVGIEPPKSLDDFPSVAAAIQAKADEYTKKRQDEIANFEANPPEIKEYREREDGDRRRDNFDRDNRAPRSGYRGDRGDRGERGERGDRGERRERGERGEQGERGDRGFRGERAERGERGPRGDQGDRRRERREDGRGLRQDRDQPAEDVQAKPAEEQPKPKPARKIENTNDLFPALG